VQAEAGVLQGRGPRQVQRQRSRRSALPGNGPPGLHLRPELLVAAAPHFPEQIGVSGGTDGIGEHLLLALLVAWGTAELVELQTGMALGRGHLSQ
jgi:hypothetical protein